MEDRNWESQGQNIGHRDISDAVERKARKTAALCQQVIDERGSKKPPPHELDPRAAAGALRASVQGICVAINSHYVRKKLMRSGLPIVSTAAAILALGYLVSVPLNAVAFLLSMVPGVRREGALELGNVAMTDVLSSLALLLMLMLRSFLHKPVYKCFIHTLRDVNSNLAEQVESLPSLVHSHSQPGAAKSGQVQVQRRSVGYKIVRMAFLMLLSKEGRRVPLIKWVVAPLMLFSSGERLLGTQNALLLALVGFVPQIAPTALDFLHLWRASHVTGSELLSDYTEHVILPDSRSEWFRQNEVAVFCFMAPQLLLMQIPVVGPLLFLPASAAAAYLADYLHRLPYNIPFQLNQTATTKNPQRHLS